MSERAAELSASLIRGEAMLLPLEMPELAEGMPLAPPADAGTPTGANAVAAWLFRVMEVVGSRCGREPDYQRVSAFFHVIRVCGNHDHADPDAALPPAVPQRGPLAVAALPERVARVIGLPELSPWHRDALLTACALLLLAGEVEVDEDADTLRRVWPAPREISRAATREMVRATLRKGFPDTEFALGAVVPRPGCHFLHVSWNGELAIALVEHALRPFWGLQRAQGRSPLVSVIRADGRAQAVEASDTRRVREDDIPPGAELVHFPVQGVRLTRYAFGRTTSVTLDR